jgi:RNA polymerase sigma-32 factor
MLDAKEEYALATRWKKNEDKEAMDRLVESHMPLAIRIASNYRNYGLPLEELVAEGHVGLMRAVKKFNPEKGCRFSTYAEWWMKASVQDFILHNWSLVRIGTTAEQKTLFFKRGELLRNLTDGGDLPPEATQRLAVKLKVSEAGVRKMIPRLLGDKSLNAPLGNGDGKTDSEHQDFLIDGAARQDEALVKQDEEMSLGNALKTLDDRERKIFKARRLSDDPPTLEVLGDQYGLSGEGVRYIERRAFKKVQQAVMFEKKRRRNNESFVILPANCALNGLAPLWVPSVQSRGAY